MGLVAFKLNLVVWENKNRVSRPKNHLEIQKFGLPEVKLRMTTLI